MYLSINGKSLVHLQLNSLLNSSKGLKNGPYFMDTHFSGKSNGKSTKNCDFYHLIVRPFECQKFISTFRDQTFLHTGAFGKCTWMIIINISEMDISILYFPFHAIIRISKNYGEATKNNEYANASMHYLFHLCWTYLLAFLLGKISFIISLKNSAILCKILWT